MHALASALVDSPGARPSLLDRPSAAYEVNASRDSAAWAEEGGCGLPTLGVLTAVFGPPEGAAVQAARPAQQQIRTPRLVRMRIVVPLTRAAAPPAGWSVPRGARGRRPPAGRRCCRSAARAGCRPG